MLHPVIKYVGMADFLMANVISYIRKSVIY